MNPLKRIFLLFRKWNYINKGYSRHYTNFWMGKLKKEYRESSLPKKERKWAYKRGFYPWRIAQYGLTDDNYKNFISDEGYYENWKRKVVIT